jgi:hypothetical protein
MQDEDTLSDFGPVDILPQQRLLAPVLSKRQDIMKTKRQFCFSIETGRRIRRQLRDDEYEYDLDDGKIIGKHRRLHRFIVSDGCHIRQHVANLKNQIGKSVSNSETSREWL